MTALPLPVYGDAAPASSRFKQRLAAHGGELRAGVVTTLQVNLTRKCNQACRHCHVGASPLRSEVMADSVVDACLDRVADAPALETLDITGGAPELHPRFREIVERARALERRTIVGTT